MGSMPTTAQDRGSTMHGGHDAAASSDRRTVFAEALGPGFDVLPAALRDLHDVVGVRVFMGCADIERGRGRLSRLVGALIGFPPAGLGVPVHVTMLRQGGTELWTRDFAGRRFRSRLSPGHPAGSGRVRERFGPIVLEIALRREAGRLAFPVTGGSLLGVPLPRFLLPISDTFEHVDAEGRACFDVRISLPLAGHLASYRGWLVPAGPGPAPRSARHG